jgi:hypothetical protein
MSMCNRTVWLNTSNKICYVSRLYKIHNYVLCIYVSTTQRVYHLQAYKTKPFWKRK